jgi:hypothetical protein
VDPSTARRRRRRLATMVAGLALLTAGATVPATATAEGKTGVRSAGAGEVRLPADAANQVTLVTAVDTAGNWELPSGRDLTVRSRLYRNGDLVEEHQQDLSSPFPLTRDPATYRLEVDVDNPGLTLAIATRTRWTFRSAAPKAGTQPVPLLLVDYDLPLDGHNQRPANTPLVVPFKVARQPSAPPTTITSAKAWFSVNEGHTWHPTVVTPQPGGRFLALPRPAGPRPKPGDLVSLKVRATDAGGSIIEETIQRAWAVAPLTTAAGDRSPASRVAGSPVRKPGGSGCSAHGRSAGWLAASAGRSSP